MRCAAAPYFCLSLSARRECFQEAPCCVALQDLDLEATNVDEPPLLPTALCKFLKNDDEFFSNISPAQSPDAIWAL